MKKIANLDEIKNEIREIENKLKKELEIKISKIKLEKLGLNIGDVVECEFYGSIKRKGKAYNKKFVRPGKIIIDKDGVRRVISLEPIPKVYYKSHQYKLSGYWVEGEEIEIAELDNIIFESKKS